MIAVLIVAFVVTGSAYCRSLPPSPHLTDINAELFNENPVPVIRLARQSGIGPGDYNPYEMFPDTGMNPNTYPQQPQQQQQPPNRSYAASVAISRTIYSGRG